LGKTFNQLIAVTKLIFKITNNLKNKILKFIYCFNFIQEMISMIKGRKGFLPNLIWTSQIYLFWKIKLALICLSLANLSLSLMSLKEEWLAIYLNRVFMKSLTIWINWW